MAHNNGIITAPISVKGDIGYVLGSNSGDVKTLCLLPNINPWSAKKPVEHNSPAYTTDQKFTELLYGLDNQKRTLGQLSAFPSSFYWKYNKPSTWFRVMDFNGYNHGATAPDIYLHLYPLYVNHPAENGRIAVTWNADGSEIPVLDMQIKTTTQSGAPSAALSGWYLCFIVYMGANTPRLFSTGHPLTYFYPTQIVDISTAIYSTDVGETADIVPCLVYPDSQLTDGLHELSGGFMNQYYAIPLSFTDAQEADLSGEVLLFEWLKGMTIGHSQIIQPQTGANTYRFSSIGVVAQQNNTGSATCNFTLKLGLRRTVSGVTRVYYSLSTLNVDITSTSVNPPLLWSFPTAANGYINFTPSFSSVYGNTTAQAGDILFLEVAYSGGLQTVTADVLTVQ